MSLQTEWRNLLVDVAVARGHRIIGAEFGQGFHIPQIDSILVSGLMIRAVSLLDESLVEYIEANSVPMTSKNPRLYHRLRGLDDAGVLQDYQGVDKWRKRRNDIGHKISDLYTWTELDECLSAIFNELSSMKVITDFPDLTFTKTIQRASPTKPGVTIEKQVLVKIHVRGKKNEIYHEFG